MYEIKTAPPRVTWARGAPTKYPFEDMKKGQYFEVPVEPQSKDNWSRAFNRVSVACYKYCQSKGIKGYSSMFEIRKIREGNPRIGIWRI